ncbi:MAG TPA: nucleotidyltransferase domain-containing protein [Candidatus Aenigmarchaeota archaeon]|nr:nucleotidyltransferase domain-containing protein [Candidatus Aenigmarchaeota archaeon]
MILKEWRKYKGWQILEYFLDKNERIHVKGLAKKLRISPRTSQIYLNFYEQVGILERNKVGNIIQYNLKLTPLTLELRRLYFLLKFFPEVRKIVEKNPDIITIALYGSHASGDFDKTSDVDLLIISQNKKLNLEPIKKIESLLKKEIKLQIFSLGEWKKKIKNKDLFSFSVLRNHIILYGAEL